MKSKLTILLLTLSIFANAQSKAAVFDMEAHLTACEAITQLDAIKQQSIDSLMVLGKGLVQKLQDEYTRIQKMVSGGCLSPRTQKEMVATLRKYEAEVNDFERSITEEIPQITEKYNLQIQDYIREKLNNLAEAENHSYIFDKENMFYVDSRQVTEIQLEITATEDLELTEEIQLELDLIVHEYSIKLESYTLSNIDNKQ